MSFEDSLSTESATPLLRALIASLAKKLEREGFSNFGQRFWRTDGRVRHDYNFTSPQYGGMYRIQAGVGVRHERVEDLFHRSSGFDPEFHAGTVTMGVMISTLKGGGVRGCEYLLGTTEQVDEVAEKVVHELHECGPPYFERWSSLDRIDAELNDDPFRRSIHRSLAWFRCSTGSIVARLVNRSNYRELVATYREIMSKDNKGFYYKWFDRLLSDLEDVSPGS